MPFFNLDLLEAKKRNSERKRGFYGTVAQKKQICNNKLQNGEGVFMKDKRNISAKRILIKTGMIFLIPFSFFMIGLNVYSSQVYYQRLIQKNLDRIQMYRSFMEEDLERVNYFMSDLIANDNSFKVLRYPQDDLGAWNRRYELIEKFDTVMKTVKWMIGFCVVNPDTGIFFDDFLKDIDYEEKEKLRDYIKNLLTKEGEEAISGVPIHQIGDKYYILKIMGVGGVYCVGVMDMDAISWRESSGEGESIMFYAQGMQVLSMQKEIEDGGISLRRNAASWISRGFLLVRCRLDYFGCDIILMEPYRGIWSAISLQVTIMTMSLIFLLLIYWCYCIWKRQFLNPLEAMVRTMDSITDGELESRLEVKCEVQEYKKVEQTFNHMIEHMRELKILAYDRLIQVQQTELQYYQIQIRPHFFLNCMKNLYALSVAGKHREEEEMILTLSSYLRLVLEDHAVTTPLERELQSVRAYIRLQQMSGSMPPVYREEIGDGLDDFEIPPMSLLTFVENSLKYTNDQAGGLQILIKIRILMGEEGRYVNITIMDNGKGFSQEVLEVLNAMDRRLSSEHIGIYNVKQRFSLIYGSECSFMFSNMNGACVDIFIPYREMGEEKDEGIGD